MKKYKTHFEANYENENESYVAQLVKREQEIEKRHKELETKILLFTFILSTTLTFCLVKLLK